MYTLLPEGGVGATAFDTSMSHIKERTFLIQAVRSGCVGLLQSLGGKEIGRQDEHGFTALMYNALLYNEILDPMLLKEAGIKSEEGKFALLYALERRHTNIAEALVATEGLLLDSKGCPPIVYAIRYGCEELALGLWDILMFSKIYPYDIVTEGAKTLCMWIAEYGMINLLRRCLEEDGMLYAMYCDLHGRTALMYAARAGYADCVRELRFFCPLARDCDGMNALMHAAQRGNADCVRTLLTSYASNSDTSTASIEENDANLNLLLGRQDNAGRTALHYAIFASSSLCIRLLIRERGIVDACGQSGGFYLVKSCILQIYLRLITFSTKYDYIDTFSVVSVENVICKVREHLLPKSHEFQGILYSLTDTLFSTLMGDEEVFGETNVKERANHKLRLKRESQNHSQNPKPERHLLHNFDSIFDHIPVEPSILCCICTTRLSSYLLYPCRHICVCSICFPAIGGSCPRCFKVVYRAERIQLEGE